MTIRNGHNDMTRLAQILDRYGADQRRWPRDEAGWIAELLQRDPAARALLSETEVFDRVLAAAPAGRKANLSALTDRIVAAATKAEGRPILVPVRDLPGQTHRRALVARWPAIAALAASLLIGFFAGMNGWESTALQQVSWLAPDTGDTSVALSVASDDDPQEGDVL